MDTKAMAILKEIRQKLIDEGNDQADMADAVKWQHELIKAMEKEKAFHEKYIEQLLNRETKL